MEIKTRIDLAGECNGGNEGEKWVALDELNNLIDNSDCFGSPRARAEFNKLVNSQSNENKKEGRK